jgi:hypothetical protein
MEATQAEAPAKICPRCAVMSRTTTDRCPNCGRRYRRRVAAPTSVGLVIAVLLGGGGYLLLRDGDDHKQERAVTYQQATATPFDSPRAGVIARLGKPKRSELTSDKRSCIYYNIEGQPGNEWQFCFRKGKLVGKATLIRRVKF